MVEQIDIVEQIDKVKAILDDLDDYLETLTPQLSNLDSLISDYQHYIENANIDEVDLKQLYIKMQETFKSRRIIKENMALRDNYKLVSMRWNNAGNRGELSNQMHICKKKLNTNYKNRILTENDIESLKSKPKKVGRPKKEAKEGL